MSCEKDVDGVVVSWVLRVGRVARWAERPTAVGGLFASFIFRARGTNNVLL